MASTITPRKALDFAKVFVKNMPVDRDPPRLRIMDSAAKMVWMAAPWPWTIGILTVTAIANDAQDVVMGTIPADFLHIQHAALVNKDTIADLTPVGILPVLTDIKGMPQKIAFVSANTVRLYPMPSGYAATELPKLWVFYKKQHTEITVSNESTAGTLVMADEWYPVYEAFVLYYVYLYADDPRAGGAQMSSRGIVQYSGMLGTAMGLLNEYKLASKVGLVDSFGRTITSSLSLAAGR
jgi:hypothetical protein